MEKLNQEQINSILELHDKWLKDIEGGVRADFSGKDLSGANLVRANLESANLVRANLESANLESANLVRANLYSANLYSANLVRANLYSANLYSANLYSANLYSANLYSANLYSANLVRANLESANLESANLVRANLYSAKEDFFNKLLLAKNEALGLYDALMKGKINGSCYSGECACFVGTIANICGQQYQNLTNGLKPDSSSATERWFLAINEGDIPQSNKVAAITADWMREFMDKEGIKYPEYHITTK